MKFLICAIFHGILRYFSSCFPGSAEFQGTPAIVLTLFWKCNGTPDVENLFHGIIFFSEIQSAMNFQWIIDIIEIQNLFPEILWNSMEMPMVLREGSSSFLGIKLQSLTHWSRDKMDAISQTTLSNAFSWMKMLEFRLTFHWSLFRRVELTISQHWFR